MSDYRPRARRDVLSEAIDDELVLYDETTHEGHSLSRVAAAVWRRCDGLTPVPELARLAGADLGAVVTDDLVWLALGELGDRRLLDEPPEPRSRALSRRELVERLGVSAGLALALVTSLPVPAAAQNGSPISGPTGLGPTGPGATGPTGATGPA